MAAVTGPARAGVLRVIPVIAVSSTVPSSTVTPAKPAGMACPRGCWRSRRTAAGSVPRSARSRPSPPRSALAPGGPWAAKARSCRSARPWPPVWLSGSGCRRTGSGSWSPAARPGWDLRDLQRADHGGVLRGRDHPARVLRSLAVHGHALRDARRPGGDPVPGRPALPVPSSRRVSPCTTPVPTCWSRPSPWSAPSLACCWRPSSTRWKTSGISPGRTVPSGPGPPLAGSPWGLILLALPQMYGVGYPVMDKAIGGGYVLWFLIVLAAGKIIACSMTLGIGGSGGVVRALAVHRRDLRHGVRRDRRPRLRPRRRPARPVRGRGHGCGVRLRGPGPAHLPG